MCRRERATQTRSARPRARSGSRFPRPYDAYRRAALAAGASLRNDGPLEPLDAIERFGRLATVEAEVLSGKPRPLVEAELWAMASEWKLKPVSVLTGTLWEKA